jgi:hypothetical protein
MILRPADIKYSAYSETLILQTTGYSTEVEVCCLCQCRGSLLAKLQKTVWRKRVTNEFGTASLNLN